MDDCRDEAYHVIARLRKQPWLHNDGRLSWFRDDETPGGDTLYKL